MLEADGATDLASGDVSWRQEVISPDPAPWPVPPLTLEPGTVKPGGAAGIYEEILMAPPSTGRYQVLKFLVSAEPFADATKRLSVTVVVSQKQ